MPEGGEGAELNTIQMLSGSMFMLSDPRGDVDHGGLGGMFHEDTRHLGTFFLTVGGLRPSLLTSGSADYNRAAFFLVNPDLDGLENRSVSIQRVRTVGDGPGSARCRRTTTPSTTYCSGTGTRTSSPPHASIPRPRRASRATISCSTSTSTLTSRGRR